jgi:tetratricopeptide (TPR) repeat protein
MVDATVAAAAAAAKVFAHDATIAQCTAGLSAIAPYGAAPEARRWRARLLCLLGQAQADAGDPALARRTLTEAHALALGTGDVQLVAHAAIHTPRTTTFLVPDRELESVLTDALQVVGDADMRLRARLLARRAVIAEGAVDRQTHSDQAVRAARELGDDLLLAEVLSARLFVLWAPDTAQERLETSSEIIDLAVRSGDVRRELDGRMWRLGALLEFGRVAEAEAELNRYEYIAERLGQPEFLFFARSRRCTLSTMRGRFDEAERLTREAHALAVDAGLPDALNVFTSQLFFIAYWRGGELIAESSALFADLDRQSMLPAPFVRADVPPAAVTPAPDQVPGPARWLYFHMATSMAYQRGDAAAARSIYGSLTPFADRFIVTGGAVGCPGAASRLLGLCALTLGRLDDAVDWLRKAAASNRQVGALPCEARAQTDLAIALRRRSGPGDADQAQGLLAEAAGIAADLGMAPLAREIGQLQPNGSAAGDDRPRLRRDGEDWVLIFDGRSTRLRHSKGLTQLAALLANPGQEISAVELAGGVDGSARTLVLDESAKRAYRHRLAELDEALRLADAHGDAASARRRETERAALVAELKRATGLAGRSRAFSDDAERARVNVTRTVRQALDRILAADPDTGRHLLGAVRTGIRCIYQPDR